MSRTLAIAEVIGYLALVLPMTFLAFFPLYEYVNLGMPEVGDKWITVELRLCFILVFCVWPLMTVRFGDAVKFLRKNGVKK